MMREFKYISIRANFKNQPWITPILTLQKNGYNFNNKRAKTEKLWIC